MIKIIISVSIILNIILIYFLNKKKIKKILFKSKIKEVDISEVHEIFESEKISLNLVGPKKETIIKSFCIPPDNKVVGMASDYEGWILAVLSKNSNKIFEFGTCSGKTTYLMALNSPENAKIYIKELEKFIETKVASISTSPERNDTILIIDPFNI